MENQQSSQKQQIWADSQTQLKKTQANSDNHSIYRMINQYPMITSPWLSSISFIIPVLYAVHLMDFYYSGVVKVYPDNTRNLIFILSDLITKDLAPIGYFISGLLTLLILITVFFNNINVEGWKYLVAWFGSRLFPILRYMVELNLVVTAFFLINDNYTAPFFVIAASLNLLINFFCQNYSLRKDYLCCKSLEFLMILKISYVLLYLVNCLGHRFITSSSSQVVFLIFLGIHLILTSVLLLTYFLFGYNIYRHTTPRYLLVCLLALKFSLSLSHFYDQINRMAKVYLENRDLVYSITFFILTTVLCLITLRRMRAVGTDPQAPLKKRIFFIFGKLQESSQDVEDDCQTRGIIRWHWKIGCRNPECYVNNKDNIYDSKKNRHCFLDKINQGKTSLIKFYIKCLYETELEKCNWDNTDLFLQYIQFYYMKLKNTFQVTHLLIDLQSRFLNPFQKLRMQRLRRVMIEENFKLNGELYLGNLDIQFIIDSQNKFNEIRQQINEVLRNNLKFWEYASENTIDLSQMTLLMKPNMKKVDQINNNWKTIAKYFQIQKIWKFYFVCYILYVKNQKLKATFLEYFGLNVREDQIFTADSYHLEKTSQAQKIFNSKMLFEPNTCCIHVNSHKERPIIKRVNLFFEKMFKYTNVEIIESALENLMTLSVRQGHQQTFLKWAGQGKSHNQATYQTKKVFPLDRDGYIVPVFKFYKEFYCLDKQIQYVAMLKKNTEDQCVAILNQNYQIEGMTACLAKKLHLNYQGYQTFCKINILAFFPSLIRYTKFQAQLKKSNEQGQSIMGITGISQQKKTILSAQKKQSSIITRKDYSKSNLKLIIPQNLTELEQIYRKHKKIGNIEFGQGQIQNYKCIFQGIKHANMFIKNEQALAYNSPNDNVKDSNQRRHQSNLSENNSLVDKRVYKFKTQIEVKQRTMSKILYYQFYIRDIQQSNNSAGNQNKSSLSGQKSFRQSSNGSNQRASHFKPKPGNQDQQSGLLDKIRQQSQIGAQDFHKFFESSHNSQSISLAFTNNIFIKQDNNKPVSMISYVRSISISVRIFFIIFVIFVGITFFIQNQNYTTYNQYCQKISQVTKFQLKILMLQNQYAIKKLNYINFNSMNTRLTKELISINQNYFFKKSIFDKTINTFNQYPAYKNAQLFQITTPPVYDQIDILNKMMEISISMEYVNNLSKTNKEYLYLQAYAFPSLESLFMTVKENLNNYFTKIRQITQIKNYVFYSAEAIFLVIGFVVVLTSLIKISHSFVSLMEIFTQFSRADLFKIQKYCDFLLHLFNYLGNKSDSLAKKVQKINWSLQNTNNINSQGVGEQQDGNVNLNKKVKKVQIGKELTNLKVKSIAYVIVFLFIYGVAAFGLNAYVGICSDYLLAYEIKGYEIFKYYSAMDVQFHGLLQKKMGNQIYLQKYNRSANLIQQMKQVRDRVSITSTSTQFQKKYNDILFDNFCKIYPQVLENDQTQIEQCQSVAQNTLQHGAQSFLYYLTSYFSNHLTVQTIKLNNQGQFQLSQNTLIHLAKAIRYSDIYLIFLLQTWQDQFKATTTQYQEYIIIICASLAVFMILVYFILIEILIVGNLQNKFNFFKKIYESYMPDFIVSKEKIIKAKLQVQGLINK